MVQSSPSTLPTDTATQHGTFQLTDTLNTPQLAAVTQVVGPMLVLAGAGSGKTRVITYRIAHLLAAHSVAPYRIYAVTFTNKAAREMRSRIQQLVGADLAGHLWIGTFHATCARILRRYHDCVGLRHDFLIYDDADQRSVMASVLEELNIDDRQFPAKHVLSILHGHKQQATPLHEIPTSSPINKLLAPAFERYQQKLITANAVDFDDLILHVMRIAEDESSAAGAELRRRFDHILVDEFQDVNISQYRLVRALAANHRSVCVVGDDDQSIYRWRGADVSIIRGFAKDFPGTQVVKLEQNYRSTGNVVRAALGVIKPSRERQPKELFTTNPEGHPVAVVQATSERDEGNFVARTIQRATKDGISPKEIAVFYRVHAQSRVLEEGLRALGIPYQIIGGTRFFDRKEIKDLLAYLRFLANPDSDVDLLRIINTPARQIGPTTVKTLVAHAASLGRSVYDVISSNLLGTQFKPAQRKRLVEFTEMIEDLRSQSSVLGPRDIAEQVIALTGYEEWLTDQDKPESEARLQNLKEMLGSISEYEDEEYQADGEPTITGYIERVSLVTDVDKMVDAPRVSMMTVHAAKGLEFDTVFVTGFEDGLFPFRSSQSPTDVEEERRLAYVAFTRARQRLFVMHASTRTIFGRMQYCGPSSFLRDIPSEAMSQHTTATFGRGPGGCRASSFSGPPRTPGERYVELDEAAPF